MYQSSTEDDSQKTEPPLKDFIVSVQNKPMEFLQVLATLFTVMCVVSYLCFVFVFVFFEETQVVDEIIVILDVESLKQRVQGDFPCFFHP